MAESKCSYSDTHNLNKVQYSSLNHVIMENGNYFLCFSVSSIVSAFQIQYVVIGNITPFILQYVYCEISMSAKTYYKTIS